MTIESSPTRATTPAPPAPPAWVPLISARPSYEAGTRVELSSPVAGCRVGVDRDALAAWLMTAGTPSRASRHRRLREGLAVAGILDQPGIAEPDGADHWRRRGWGQSLAYYLASRTATFIEDTAPPAERDAVRATTVRQMLAADPLPAPPVARRGARPLPTADTDLPAPLGAVLAARRSTFDFPGHPATRVQVAATLWHGLHLLRSCRSGDPARHPLDALRSIGSAFDVYLLAYDITGLAQGSYFYEPERHRLDLQQPGDHRETFQRLLVGQPSPRKAAAAVLLVADFPRYQWRYRHERALRTLYTEAGRLVQYLLLAATATRLRTHITPALRDSDTLDFLSLPTDTHQAMYCLTLGG